MHLMGCIKIQGLTVITQAWALTSFDVCAHQSGPAKAALAQRAASSSKGNYFHDVVSHSKGVHGQVAVVQLLEATG